MTYTREELKPPVNYEVEMFVGAAVYSALPDHPLYKRYPAAKNWLVENFVFHMRNLIDFMWRAPDPVPGRGPRDTDIHVGRFLDGADLAQWERDARPKLIDDMRGEAHTRAAHLTEARIKQHPNDVFKWPIIDIYEELAKRWKWFVLTTTTRFEARFPETLEAARLFIAAQPESGFRDPSPTEQARSGILGTPRTTPHTETDPTVLPSASANLTRGGNDSGDGG